MLASSLLKALWSDEAGMTTVEYALLLALVTIASIGAWSTLGGTKMRMTANAVATYVGGG
jgi:Flp pilus assembly pilin Flp